MAQVGIVMGSDSDMPIMAKAADILEELGVSYEMTIISAHREPDVFFEYARTAEDRCGLRHMTVLTDSTVMTSQYIVTGMMTAPPSLII